MRICNFIITQYCLACHNNVNGKHIVPCLLYQFAFEMFIETIKVMYNLWTLATNGTTRINAKRGVCYPSDCNLCQKENIMARVRKETARKQDLSFFRSSNGTKTHCNFWPLSQIGTCHSMGVIRSKARVQSFNKDHFSSVYNYQ